MLKSLLATSALALSLTGVAYADQHDAVEAEDTQIDMETDVETGNDLGLGGEADGLDAHDDADMMDEPAPMDDAAPMDEAGDWGAPVDIATIAAEDLIGSDVRTLGDETIATVDDVLMSPEGEMQSLIVTFGGFLGFGQTTVELMPDEFDIFREADDTLVVRTSLMPEELENRPEYDG